MGQAPRLTGPDLSAGIEISRVPENMPLLGHANGAAVILVRKESVFHALGATCSHYSGPLGDGIVVGQTVRCPWHHACFDLRTGEAVGAPALDSIPCYEVVRNGDRVSVGAKKTPLLPVLAPSSGNVASKIVIVGAGAAGAAAAEKLRRLGYAGAVTLVGDEAPGPVDRPNLSKDFLAGNAPMEWVTLRDDAFYEKLQIEFIKGDAAVELEVKDKSITLGSSRKVSYDKLLLATGSEPVRLPIEGASLPHVKTLRTLADAQAIITAATPGSRVVVVGSSFIGLEVAASLRARHLEVDVVSRDDVPLGRILGPRVGKFAQQLHEAKGVHFHLGAKLRTIHADAVELETGRLAADFVVLGVGVKPRTDLAKRAGLEIDNGIVVDSRLRTSAPEVWAAGDIARYPEARLGTKVRIEHWAAAQRQGQSVAADMLGLGGPFNDVPFFWSAHYDVTLSYVGHADGDAETEVLGSLEKRDAAVIYRVGGNVAAVLTVGRDQQSLEIEAALESRDWGGLDALLREFAAGT
jgi:NADPH-dependent 2,4-dienoyl-CoA reductase/sulfur reductase-like enzyme/nitrite reductase/ring-hydroxylating ferredoxin subunit